MSFRPKLTQPKARVFLVCGPPASGKSTYVAEHKREGDHVFDLDLLAKEMGLTRDRPPHLFPRLLLEWEKRLRHLEALSESDRAWVLIGGAGAELRDYWAEMLGVQPGDRVLLVPSRRELIRRIVNDPDRIRVRVLHQELVDKWFEAEDGTRDTVHSLRVG